MRILALNCGSSSIKSVLVDTQTRERVLEMRIENLGTANCRLVTGADSLALQSPDARTAIARLFEEIRARTGDGEPIAAVAHRIAHGGADFLQPARLDAAVLKAIAKINPLAPLHNPFALDAAAFALERLPDVPHVAVFDTAFHSTLPPRARQYALPTDLAERLGIRRYGFHGTSYAQVTRSIARHLSTEPQALRIVACHLGSGASVAAVEYGRSVETSMGMTPLEGLVMGTRCGDLDPGAVLYLLQHGYDADALDKLLNTGSGMKGLTGSNDLREIEQRAQQGDEACRLAITVYAHRVRKYIGAYAAVMGGVDVIVFTGGIGENSALMRHRILQRFDFLGARLDEDRNRDVQVTAAQPIADIGEAGMRTRLFVVRADEELEMALQTAATISAHAAAQPVRIPIEVSARHAHLTQATIEKLFGPGYQLRVRGDLSQHGQYSAEETVALIGSRGRIDKVRLMGPPRDADQVEISRSDEFVLGIDAPVRISGDLRNTPGITLQGPAGRITIGSGVICARRHIHMNLEDAQRIGVHDHDTVSVRIDSEGRDLVFNDVTVRVAADFQLRLHLDTDEANAAGVQQDDTCELVR